MAKDVFISGVSSEFEKVRELIKTDLDTRGIGADTQATFRQQSDQVELLGKLNEAIYGCKVVVCIHGSRSGSAPPASVAARYADFLPPGITEASYTQWEFFFARYWRKDIKFFRATAQYVPEREAGDDVDGLQERFLAHVEEGGRYYKSFSSADELRRQVSLEDWSPLASRAWSIGIIIPFAVLINIISYMSGAPTIMALMEPDILSRPSVKPDIEFFLSEQFGGQALFMAKSTKSTNDKFASGLRICNSAAAQPGSATVSDPCRYYDPTDEEFSNATGGSALKPGFWSFDAKQPDFSYSFARTAPDGKTHAPWIVQFDQGTPCITLGPKSKCLALGTYHGEGSSQEKDLRKQIYFNQLQLESRYDLITEKLYMLRLVFALGFSILISIMTQELTKCLNVFGVLSDKILSPFGLRRIRAPAM
jgi:hypothetical protein